MGFVKHTQAEQVAPVTPAQNERANVVRDAGGQPKLANLKSKAACQQPGACVQPNCDC